eukprot:CAMPEP_0172199102 /NCGR_PEP_ID=MMETSP1050-20130122/28484_1 /TAXON_ID=233186 /ORGANISM="Cryptomonas curvata, Strain CCAP979/52" /LENGTH=123 /DNA_ID=CAMNT_0012876053 /DNA_START=246 /DNA_END=617 /DNA_ORIENTATION=-
MAVQQESHKDKKQQASGEMDMHRPKMLQQMTIQLCVKLDDQTGPQRRVQRQGREYPFPNPHPDSWAGQFLPSVSTVLRIRPPLANNTRTEPHRVRELESNQQGPLLALAFAAIQSRKTPRTEA